MRTYRTSLVAFLALFLLLAPSQELMGAEGRLCEIGKDVSPPKPISKVPPQYTKRAKKAKLQGIVRLAIIVNSEGVPEAIKVIDSLDPDLDAEAVKAVSQWRFKPAEQDGRPCAVTAKVEVKFRLCCRW